MSNLHPIFVNIFRAYGVAPTEDEEEERCPMCSLSRVEHEHCSQPCPFDECPFKEMK